MRSCYYFILLAFLQVLFVSAAPTTGLQFNGTATSYIDCGNKSEFSPGQFTVEAWINYQTLNDGYIISNEGWGTGAEGFKIHTFGSKLEFAIGANTVWTSLQSKTNIATNTWYHIAVTYTSSTMNIYLNGVLDNTCTITGSPMIASTQNLCIGEGSAWKGREMTGKLADIRFWNIVRTQEEIFSSMSSSLTGTEAGLVADWKMNEGTGTTVADATGNHPLSIPSTVTWFTPSTQEPIRVVCVGNSITAGVGASDGAHAYPAQLGGLLGSKYLVLNCGVSGRTMLKRGDFPYWNEAAYITAKNADPQIVIISLGTNDSKSFNWVYKNDFFNDYASMIADFRSGGKNPHIFVCFPPPSFSDNYSISNAVICHEILPLVDSIRTAFGTSAIDYYHALLPYGNDFPDGIHPNDAGAFLMAQIACKAITRTFGITSVKSPVSKSSLTSNEQITITINNNHAQPLTNVPVVYKIDENTEVKEVIGLITGNTEIDYKFVQKADLSQNKEYSITVYTAIDTAKTNDTLTIKVTNYKTYSDRALFFSGNNGKVAIPDAASLMPTAAFTLEAWIYPTQFKTYIYQGTVISKESTAGGYALNVGGDGQGRLVIGNPNWIEAVIPAKSINLNQWSHIAGVYDGSTLKFYVNGELKITTTNAGSIKASTSPLYIGESAAFSGREFIGGIDEVSIWSRALTPEEIKSNKDYLLLGNEAGLVAYYNMNQIPGSDFVRDSTGNGHDGIIQNMDSYTGWMAGTGLSPNIKSSIPKIGAFTDVSIYPNPTTDFMYIKSLPGDEETQLIITDILGTVVLNRFMKNASPEIKIDVHNYTKGVYMVALNCTSERKTMKLVIK